MEGFGVHVYSVADDGGRRGRRRVYNADAGETVLATCSNCGADLPDQEGWQFCLACSTWVAPPAKPPSQWQRVITGVIGLILLTVAASLFLFTEVWGAGFMALAPALPFVLATIVPYGAFRRLLVALGRGLLAAAMALPAVAGLIFAMYFDGETVNAPSSAEAMLVVAPITAFCLGCYWGYRVAR